MNGARFLALFGVITEKLKKSKSPSSLTPTSCHLRNRYSALIGGLLPCAVCSEVGLRW